VPTFIIPKRRFQCKLCGRWVRPDQQRHKRKYILLQGAGLVHYRCWEKLLAPVDDSVPTESPEPQEQPDKVQPFHISTCAREISRDPSNTTG
jgi:hypothetical protein